jgi:PKD repeat protein
MEKRFLLLLVIFLSIRSFAAVTPKLALTITDVNSQLFDQVQVYFDSGQADKFTSPQDVQQNLDSSAASNLPLIYTFTSDGVACSLNGHGGFNASTQIAVGVYIKPGSTCIISSAQITNFDPTTMITLEDKQMNTRTDLRVTGYTFQADSGGEINNRFILHLSFPPQIATVIAGCSNEAGVVSVTEDTSITWTSCNLLDENQSQVAQYLNISGNFTFANLAAGNYTIQFLYGDDAPSKPASVPGDKIVPVINPTLSSAQTGEKITFNSQAEYATVFNWNFGDGSTLSDVSNPVYAYSQPGTYTVTLQCNNEENCLAYAYTQVTISQATGVAQLSADVVKIIDNGKQVEVKIEGEFSSNYSYELYDISGRKLQSAPLTSSDFTLSLSPYNSGIYIFNVKSADSSFAKKIWVTE